MPAQHRKAKSHLRQAIEAHIGTLAPDAPLRRAVASPEIEEQLAAFDRADAIAIAKQKSYCRFGRLALWAMMIGTVIGALALMPIDRWIEGWPRHVIEVVQTLALVVTFTAIICISLLRPVDRWMRARAAAERLRAEVFRDIMQAEVPGADANVLLHQKLACFINAHLESQLAFFNKRGKEHRQSAGAVTPFRVAGYVLSLVSILIGLAVVAKVAADYGLSVPAIIVAVAQWLLLPEPGRWQLGLGTIASSILAFASARSLMDQDDRNATSYVATAALVEEIKRDDLPKAEAAAAAGDSATVSAFCEKVQTVLSAEHLAWILARPPVDPPAGPDARIEPIIRA